MSFEWAVGLFEGEGSLFKDKRSNTWTLQMRMTDKDVVQMFADVMSTGGKVHDESNQPRRILQVIKLVIAGLVPVKLKLHESF
jgi:hypothetical protein